MHTEQTSFQQGVSTGWSTIFWHMPHVKSSRGTVVDGRKREGERGDDTLYDGSVVCKSLCVVKWICDWASTIFSLFLRSSALSLLLEKMHVVQLELCGFQSNGVMELVVVSSDGWPSCGRSGRSVLDARLVDRP